LFGRSQVSEPLTFSTSDPSAPEEVDIPEPLAGDGNAAGIVSRFQRFGANYLVELRLEPPSSIYVGSRGLARCLPDDMFHDGLNCGLVRSTVACLNCHSAHIDLLNVSSTEAKITLPPEYPTSADGQITCTSCHSPHSSDYRYYTRKPSEQEFCASCHLSAI
jgi:predicted CXXCH cytochrome family protein